MSELPERPPRPPLLVLIAISALQPFALNVLAPALPGMTRSLETDYSTIQLTLTLYLVTVAAVQLVVGPISDRIGRRPCILAGVALFIAGSVLGAAAAQIETLLAARVVQAMGGGTCFALARAVVRDVAPKDEAASLIGYIAMVMVLSPMVAPLIGGFIDAEFGWRAIFLAALALATPVALGSYWFLHETAPRTGASSLREVFQGFPFLVRNRFFVGYTLALAFTTATFFLLIGGAPYVVVETMGQPPTVYGAYFIANGVGYMAGNFISGRFGRRLGSERLIFIGVAVSVFSVLLELPFVLSGWWTPATLFLPLSLNAVGNGMTIPGGMASALSVRPDLAGTASGLAGATQLGLGALASMVVGHTVPLWPASLVYLMLLCSAAACLSLWFAARRSGN
jgi:DHA1 family bicyclomycin/chloramphenicol resistance-like MFS transporter